MFIQDMTFQHKLYKHSLSTESSSVYLVVLSLGFDIASTAFPLHYLLEKNEEVFTLVYYIELLDNTSVLVYAYILVFIFYLFSHLPYGIERFTPIRLFFFNFPFSFLFIFYMHFG